MEMIVQPSSDKVPKHMVNLLVESTAGELVKFKVPVILMKVEIHDFISKHRNQLRSSDFLLWILEKLITINEIKI